MSIRESRLVNKIWKAQHLALSKLGLRSYARAHKPILRKYLSAVLKATPHPTVIETGCIRDATEGTESTLTIASTLMGRGVFYTFEISREHISVCQELCKPYNQYINYVEGDSVENLTKMAEEDAFDTIHFALFDSVNDGTHIWKEFKAVEHLFKRNTIIIVDDVLWGGDKGRLMRPYLEAAPEWQTKVYNVEYGILVAQKVDEARGDE
ncbi:MAG: hypothetical protein O7E52_19215 [Candidatus Poribacteria bacterium]|nr:hypothetical protein [Candidatus Poribacteria bacterium]